MPRRNGNARERIKVNFHGATHFHSGYKTECADCIFVGYNFSCATSDGECIKTHKAKPEPEDNSNAKRLCNT